MRTIISGPVTAEHLERAELLMGIAPSSFVTNGRNSPPASAGLPVDVYPVCKMIDGGGPSAVAARDYTLCLHAEALVLVGENDHLLSTAEKYDLLIHHEPS